MRIAVTAAPSMELSRVRRSALPMVVPKPRSKGWALNLPNSVGERLGIDCQALRFLKSSPKHICFSFPARHVRRDAFCGGRASSPSVEMQLLASSCSAF